MEIRRGVLASVLALAVGAPLVAVPDTQAAMRLPGWRTAYDPTTVIKPANATDRPTTAVFPTYFDFASFRATPVESTAASPVLIVARGGRAGIDQSLESPITPFIVTVTGRLRSGRAELITEWSDADGGMLRTDRRPLRLASGRQTETLLPPANVKTLRLLVVQLEEGGILQLDSVQARDRSGRQLLANPDLTLAGCPVTDAEHGVPYGPVIVPSWRPRFAGQTTTTVGRRSLDPTVRVISTDGLAGLDQSVDPPGRPVTVTVGGYPTTGKAVLQVGWSKRSNGGGQKAWREIAQQSRPLRLSGGVQRERFGRGPRDAALMTVAVIQMDPGQPLDLAYVGARAGGRQLLRNTALRPGPCPAPLTRGEPARTISPILRWPLTLVVVALVLAALAVLVRWLERDVGQGGHEGELAAQADVEGGTGAVDAPAGTKRWLLVAVAALPFVSVGTVKAGVRLIAADWLFTVLAVALLVAARGRRRVWRREHALALSAAAVLVVVSAVALALGVALYSDANLARLPTRDRLLDFIGSPEQRGLIDFLRLVQGVLALYAVLVLTRDAETWLRVARVVMVTGVAVGALGLYQVLGDALLGGVPQPPNAFPYPELGRASGTFPEPTAYAGYMVFAGACTAVLLLRQPTRARWAALAFIVFGLLLSRSTAGLAALAAPVLGALLIRQWRLVGAMIAILAVAGALLVAVAGPSTVVTEVIEKPFSEKASSLDRRATWRAGLGMGATYAPFGVGRGQFAYNFAPFVEPEDVARGGRAQSAAVEVWAESGPAGMVAALAMVGAAAAALRRSRGKTSRYLALFWATIVATLLTYYTSSYAWTWVAVGLATTSVGALCRPPPGSRGAR